MVSKGFVSRANAKLRRVLLVTGGAGLVASLPARVMARDPSNELALEAYTGQSHGEWTCGPKGLARYGGLGARVRFSERPPNGQHGAGLRATIGGVAEREETKVLGCADRDRCPRPERALFGGGFTFGNRLKYAGVSLGLLLYQGYATPALRDTSWAAFPAFELDFGEEARGLSFPVGIGSPLVSTYRRPALVYTGPRFATRALKFELLGGLYRSGPATAATVQVRGDAALHFRLSERLWLGPHASLSAGEPVDGELGLRLSLDF